jgi:hypothetical protein
VPDRFDGAGPVRTGFFVITSTTLIHVGGELQLDAIPALAAQLGQSARKTRVWRSDPAVSSAAGSDPASQRRINGQPQNAMVILVLIGVPLVLGLVAAAATHGLATRATLALLGVGAWIAVLVYAVAIHHCRAGEECDTGFLWFFGLFALFGWLIGLLIGSLARRRLASHA